MALIDLFIGRLTVRRLIVLLEQLPPAARLGRAHDPRNAWTVGDYLTAQVADMCALVADEIAVLRWTYVAANRGKGKAAPKKPKPYPRLPRPGEPDRPPRVVRRDPRHRPARVRPADHARHAAAAGVPVTVVGGGA